MMQKIIDLIKPRFEVKLVPQLEPQDLFESLGEESKIEKPQNILIAEVQKFTNSTESKLKNIKVQIDELFDSQMQM